MFKVTLFAREYTKVDSEYKSVEVPIGYTCDTWDDLQNFLFTIIDASDKDTVKFEVQKKEAAE